VASSFSYWSLLSRLVSLRYLLALTKLRQSGPPNYLRWVNLGWSKVRWGVWIANILIEWRNYRARATEKQLPRLSFRRSHLMFAVHSMKIRSSISRPLVRPVSSVEDHRAKRAAYGFIIVGFRAQRGRQSLINDSESCA
jgi:hypothetical protein